MACELPTTEGEIPQRDRESSPSLLASRTSDTHPRHPLGVYPPYEGGGVIPGPMDGRIYNFHKNLKSLFTPSVFITLTDSASGKTVINANHIVRMSARPEGGTVVFLVNGSFSVNESPAEIGAIYQ